MAASTLGPLPAGRHARPRGSEQCHRPPVRKSIHFIIDPKSARGSARRMRFTRDVSIFQQGEEKRGTNPTDPTHGSLVLENTWRCGREKLWVRGALAEMGRGHLCHPPPPPPLPRDTCEEFATHLETHKRQMHFAAHPPPPSLHLPHVIKRCRRPPPASQHPRKRQTPFLQRGRAGPRGESATEISWLERKEVVKATGSQ